VGGQARLLFLGDVSPIRVIPS